MKKFRIWFYPSILFFAIFMISACSFGNQGGARLCITLPYGTSRQADGEEYNFEIKIQKKLGHTLFSQKGKSGDTISFLLPTGQYIVEGIAWNQSGTVYVARENTSIKDDDDVFVTLSMKNYSTTLHASAEPFSDGIKITLKHTSGEGGWLINGDSFIEIHTESGRYDRIRFISAPSDSTPSLDYYYPFTKAGEICYFKLTLATEASGGVRSTEEFAAVAGGGKLDLFTDYDPSKIKLTLDSNGIVRMSDNPMKCLNESKLNQFDQLYFDFGVWGINSDKYDWSSWVATNLDTGNSAYYVNIVNNGTQTPSSLERFLSNGLSIPEIIAADTDAVYRSRNYSKYFVSASCTCIFDEYPYQQLITTISEDVTPIMKMPAIKFPSQTAHVKAEPDAKGIKLTFDFSDKPPETNDTSMFHLNISESGGFIMDSDFTLDSTNKVEYYYPFTESGKSYTLKCIASCAGHDSLFTETISSNAGGGVLKTLFTGTISDITMTINEGAGGKNIKLNKDPRSIFNSGLLGTCNPFFDFYGTDYSEPEKDWNFIGNFNNGDASIADLLSGTLPVSNVKLDSASGNRHGFFNSTEASNYSNCWIKGGVSFSLNAYPDEYFVFQGKGFSTTGNIVVSMTDIITS